MPSGQNTQQPIMNNRGVYGSGWVGFRGFFDPTDHGGSKKIQPNPSHKSNPTQPNPYGSGWVGLNPWVWQFIIIIIIIIKLSRKKYKY